MMTSGKPRRVYVIHAAEKQIVPSIKRDDVKWAWLSSDTLFFLFKQSCFYSKASRASKVGERKSLRDSEREKQEILKEKNRHRRDAGNCHSL